VSRRAVFLDRDGTLNTERGFVTGPDELEVLPGVLDAVRALDAAGFALVVLTNQSGIARGLYGERDLARIHEVFHDRLEGRIRAWLHCPHHPTEGGGPYTFDCPCRKPADGLFRQAIDLLDLDPRRSWLVGDSARDLLPARGHGVRTVLVRSGKPNGEQRALLARENFVPDLECDDLAAAARAILAIG
jgi:D-glycero-D-manno-heptose 1,7-bisphosphate phosphatase